MLKLFALLAGLLAASVALAQTQPLPEPNDAARVLVAAPWELSNPDRDRRCQVTFKLDAAPPGRAIMFAPACAVAFPDLRPAADRERRRRRRARTRSRGRAGRDRA